MDVEVASAVDLAAPEVVVSVQDDNRDHTLEDAVEAGPNDTSGGAEVGGDN
jgi:hypothetical protein